MDKNVGIPVEEFVKSVVEAYLRGYDDAIKYLTVGKKQFNSDQLKSQLIETLKQQGKIKAEW
jgi:hypothetical protein